MKNEPQQEVPSAIDVIAKDEFAGMGGSYVFDPETGIRTPQPLPTEEKE